MNKCIIKILFLSIILAGLVVLPQKIHCSNITLENEIDTLLSAGIKYQKLLVKNGSRQHMVHLIEADLYDPDVSVALIQANGTAGEQERLHDMARRYDSTNIWNVAAAVNGSFWSAYSGFPIGPTFIDGEPIRISRYKEWSSIFFDVENKPYIGSFDINAAISGNDGALYKIDNVNRRNDSLEIVVYNKFAGDSVPRVLQGEVDKFIEDNISAAWEDSVFRDETDIYFDNEKFENELRFQIRADAREYGYYKMALSYLLPPAVNRAVPCRIVKVGGGSAGIPENGCVISFGMNDIPASAFSEGDTVYLNYNTNVFTDKVFKNSVSATPRLVAGGIADEKGEEEGSSSRRFINSRLPRTAIGTNKDKTKLYLAVVQRGDRKNGTNGASLQDMAEIMKAVGSYDAMNLDGGGSSNIYIQDADWLLKFYPEFSRKIALAIAIIRNSGNFYDGFLDD